MLKFLPDTPGKPVLTTGNNPVSMVVLVAGVKAFLFNNRCVLLCFTASLTMHIALAINLLHAETEKPKQPQPEILVVQLIGVISNRQTEQKQLGESKPLNMQKTAIPLRKEIKKAVEKVVKPKIKTQNPVKVKHEKIKPKTEQPKTMQALPPISSQTLPIGEDTQQPQQTLKTHESEASLIRKYLAGLKKDIQNHLDYPKEEQEPGNVGAPEIRFTITETGDILPGSLSINKSSGSAQLDEQALQAARKSAPMAKPPRQMTVTIKVAFTHDW